MLLDKLIDAIGAGELVKSLAAELTGLSEKIGSGRLKPASIAKETGKFARDMMRVAKSLNDRLNAPRLERKDVAHVEKQATDDPKVAEACAKADAALEAERAAKSAGK
jgi:hypothetical protein